jgi:hypothetical protein
MFIDKEFDLYLLNNQQTLHPNISLIATKIKRLQNKNKKIKK